MYHAIAKRIARSAFEAVNEHDYDALLKLARPDIHHRFGGDHALGGERHDVETLRAWFERLGRVLPTLHLTVTDLWVKGGPWNTRFFIRWDAASTLADGRPYANRGVHLVHMRWGKIVSIDAHEDSLAVERGLARQAASGIAEAVAAPVVS